MTALAELKTGGTGWRHVILEMLTGLRAALLRFPIPVLFLAAATIQALLLIADIHLVRFEAEPGEPEVDIVFGLAGGALAALAACLFGETHGLSSPVKAVAGLAAGIAAATLLAFADTFLAIEWTLLSALVGLVLVAPFIGRGTSGSFWMFSAHVAFAALLGILALLLFAGGISAILASLTVLFGLTVPDDLYSYVWTFTGLFAAPLFAMGQFPDGFDEQPNQVLAGFMDRGMRALGDFVAAPLLIVYAVILHLYALKIVVTGEVPEGQIGWLVLVYGLCIFGALLVVNPFFDRARAPTRLFLRLWPFFLPIPLVLLFYALGVRIGAYGVTPERYLLGLFGLVTAAILAVQLLPRLRGDIRVIAGIPIAALILGSFGPQGAVGVSLSSQAGRFLAIARNPPVEGNRHEEALAALRFLDSHRALARVAPEGTAISYEAGGGYRATALAWGLDPSKAAAGPRGITFVEGSGPTVSMVAGFDVIVQNLQLAINEDSAVSADLPSGTKLTFTLEPDAVIIARGEERTRFPIGQQEIERIAREDHGNKVEIRLESSGRRVLVLPSYLYADIGEPSKLQNLQGTVLLRAEDWR
ncbi:DUF4153 domain-containing protein [Chelativorans sp. AA-79]|uniref:DUF4153 domain-containing protein n=1 Tax=Chelativorans sp. AA-79 TaxID=3028735 RepID=UPI0023F94371|nr:DUF4153 domain-containing protein [Chelativorans sp. AA-79]WEX07316.1 DUF4153 domain-containing protein [Chelativorans sp. AA-79]